MCGLRECETSPTRPAAVQERVATEERWNGNLNGELITRDIIAFPGFEPARAQTVRACGSSSTRRFHPPRFVSRPPRRPLTRPLFPGHLARSAKYLIYLESCWLSLSRGKGRAHDAWDCLRNMRQSFSDPLLRSLRARYHLFQLPFVRSSAPLRDNARVCSTYIRIHARLTGVSRPETNHGTDRNFNMVNLNLRRYIAIVPRISSSIPVAWFFIPRRMDPADK